MELPPIIVESKEHFFVICKDILINFYKGRKVLVICDSIKEAKIIEDELKRFKREKLDIFNEIIDKDDHKESIILYTRSDIEKSNLKNLQNKKKE